MFWAILAFFQKVAGPLLQRSLVQQTYADELPYNQAEVGVYVQETYSYEVA